MYSTVQASAPHSTLHYSYYYCYAGAEEAR